MVVNSSSHADLTALSFRLSLPRGLRILSAAEAVDKAHEAIALPSSPPARILGRYVRRCMSRTLRTASPQRRSLHSGSNEVKPISETLRRSQNDGSRLAAPAASGD
jgi:hypothetical protein